MAKSESSNEVASEMCVVGNWPKKPKEKEGEKKHRMKLTFIQMFLFFILFLLIAPCQISFFSALSLVIHESMYEKRVAMIWLFHSPVTFLEQLLHNGQWIHFHSTETVRREQRKKNSLPIPKNYMALECGTAKSCIAACKLTQRSALCNCTVFQRCTFCTFLSIASSSVSL